MRHGVPRASSHQRRRLAGFESLAAETNLEREDLVMGVNPNF